MWQRSNQSEKSLVKHFEIIFIFAGVFPRTFDFQQAELPTIFEYLPNNNLWVDTEFFYEKEVYDFFVVAIKGDKVAVFKQTAKVVLGEPPAVSIEWVSEKLIIILFILDLIMVF